MANWERRVILKAEVTDKGRNPRFVVTHPEGDAQAIYDEIYCARGEMEWSKATKTVLWTAP